MVLAQDPSGDDASEDDNIHEIYESPIPIIYEPPQSLEASEGNGVKEVCYEMIGCFRTDGPMSHVPGKLPDSPEKINTTFYVHERIDTVNPKYDISYNQVDQVGHAMVKFWSHGYDFDPRKDQIVIFIHGFNQNAFKDNLLKLKVISRDSG